MLATLLCCADLYSPPHSTVTNHWSKRRIELNFEEVKITNYTPDLNTLVISSRFSYLYEYAPSLVYESCWFLNNQQLEKKHVCIEAFDSKALFI